MKNVIIIFSIVCLLLSAHESNAVYRCQADMNQNLKPNLLDNPCPDPDDIVLPMPGGQIMVFHSVPVPGENFWGGASRNVMMGFTGATPASSDQSIPIFETPQRVSVAGSFPNEEKSWNILIGKYEVTVAQYAALMGNGNIDRGIQILLEDSNNWKDYRELAKSDLEPYRREQLLSRPVTAIPLRSLQEIPAHYTRWCYQNDNCLAALPCYGIMPGFIRLPTEIEWEYAARSTQDNYADLLPFPMEQAAEYGHISTDYKERTNRISVGSYLPINGLYDLFGNVEELTDGRFWAELNSGKPGGFAVRGGTYKNKPKEIRTSMRSERPEFYLAGENIRETRSPLVGIRLAIGSQNQPDTTIIAKISAQYKTWRGSNEQFQSASGTSTRALLLNTNDPLENIEALLSNFERKNIAPSLMEDLGKIRKQVEQARFELKRTAEELVFQLTQNTIFTAGEAGRSIKFIAQRESGIKDFSKNCDDASCRSLVEKTKASIEYYQKASDESLDKYTRSIRDLASYRDFAKKQVESMEKEGLSGMDAISLGMVKRHLYQELSGKGNPQIWRQDVIDRFRNWQN